jgi:predicted nucleic acid-binding protein
MPERIAVDTGPLVAILAKSDANHEQCVAQTKNLAAPFLTTWAVLTEAAWLLRSDLDCIPKLYSLVETGLVTCVDLDITDFRAISQMAVKSRDLRPQLADLSLVRIADRESISTIFTLDRRDFNVYRSEKGSYFRLVP